MNKFLPLLLPMLGLLFLSEVRAECPSQFPDRPSPEVLRECLNEIAQLRDALRKANAVAVPVNAVLAFHGRCPTSGWRPFEPATGRVIIGAGIPNDPKHKMWQRGLPSGGFENVPLTPKGLDESGGEENHILSQQEMPAHSHNAFRANGDGDGLYPKAAVMGPRSQPIVAPTQDTGGSQAHNTMPPWYALNFCIRVSDDR